jgi:hypothetical protein
VILWKLRENLRFVLAAEVQTLQGCKPKHLAHLMRGGKCKLSEKARTPNEGAGRGPEALATHATRRSREIWGRRAKIADGVRKGRLHYAQKCAEERGPADIF